LDIAAVRILRLATGTSLSLGFSQAVAWDMSFIAPVITLLLLATPLPAPKLKGGLAFVVVLSMSLFMGLLLLPTLQNQPLAGLLLLTLALFWSFYYTAKGGSALLGTFATVGIAVSTAIGSVNLDAVIAIVQLVSFGTLVGVLFVWVAHAILPDSISESAGSPAVAPPKTKPEPDLAEARWSAFRSLVIVLPVALWFMFSSSSAAYLAVMIKVATMGQQAGNVETRVAARSLLQSTVIGGIGAVIGWQVLRIAPTLLGRKIFKDGAMHAQAATWSYGFMTMMVILAPAVLDSAAGGPAGIKFWDRLSMFGFATVYAVGAVYVFDVLANRKKALSIDRAGKPVSGG
jgi:hypothetical protein